METRKVQLSGGTTYTISLPKAWAKEHGIESGTLLALHPKGDGSLLVEPGADRESPDWMASIDVSTDTDDAIRRRIRAAHAVGIDGLTLVDSTGHPTDRRQLVERTIDGLSGFEILETSDTRLRLRNLIDAENVGIRKNTLRLRLVMLAMHRDAILALTQDDDDLARQVVRRDNEADKLLAMITRHFRRSLSNLHEVEKLGWSRNELFEYYYAARQFERIADHAEKIAGFTIEPDASVPAAYTDEISDLGEAARDVVDEAADVVLTDAGIETANAALARRDALMERIEDLDRTLYEHDASAEAYVLGMLLDSLRRTAEYGANVAAVGVQCVTRQHIE